MTTLIFVLKIIGAAAVILYIVYYWITRGPPPRGRGRWRDVLRDD